MTTTAIIHEFDYVVIQCGYTGRLVRRLDEIREKSLEILECNCDDSADDSCPKCLKRQVVYIGDIQCGDPADVACVLGLLTKDQLYDSICFPSTNLFESFALVKMLTKYGHCACFGKIPYKMEIVQGNYNDKTIKILVMDFDTESG